jgi:hypothetical protein
MVATSGCLFHRHRQKAPAIATETEATFEQRWVAKRQAELQAGGVKDAAEARRQAIDEFRKKYTYLDITHKPDPEAGR